LGDEANSQRAAPPGKLINISDQGRGRDDTAHDGAHNGLADAGADGSQGRLGVSESADECLAWPGGMVCRVDDITRTGPTNGFWRDADWLFCRDGKWRPVEPGTFPLAHGSPARVGRMCAACLEASPESANEEDLRELRLLPIGADGCLPPEVLQPSVPMGSADKDTDHRCAGPMASAEQVPEQALRGLRGRGGEPQASPGREPTEQPSGEHQDSMSQVPHGGTPTCERCGSDDYVYEVRIEGNSRVARLRGYGNAIVAPVAQEFIESVMEILE